MARPSGATYAPSVHCRFARGEGTTVVAVFEDPALTQESYEEAVRRLTDGKSRLESAADWPVEGIVVHAAGQGPTGFRLVDVWESEEAFGCFGEVLGPILQELGIERAPQVYPTRTLVTN